MNITINKMRRHGSGNGSEKKEIKGNVLKVKFQDGS
jgi:hypothetical protein